MPTKRNIRIKTGLKMLVIPLMCEICCDKSVSKRENQSLMVVVLQIFAVPLGYFQTCPGAARWHHFECFPRMKGAKWMLLRNF